MEAWELPVLWERPADCMCEAILVHGGGIYRIARKPNPICNHNHPPHPNGPTLGTHSPMFT